MNAPPAYFGCGRLHIGAKGSMVLTLQQNEVMRDMAIRFVICAVQLDHQALVSRPSVQ